MSFENKNILIIGASSGIGERLAERLQTQNANLFTASRTMNAAIKSQFFYWDVNKKPESVFDSLPDKLHGLVYLPGTINLKPFHRFVREDFMNDFQVNVMGAIAAIQSNLGRLKSADGASIVLFSTVATKIGMGFHTSIAISKGAIEGLAISLASELASYKIRCNVIAPSLTDTPLTKNLLSNEEKRIAAAKRHPLGRVGTANDISAMAQLLLSDEGSWITGQIIGIDGGMSSLK